MAGTAIVRIGNKEWQVSVATTPAELASGLGGVASLAPGTGMLFDLGWERTVQVTTEPMLFALDIVFIRQDLTVVDVVRAIHPGNIISEETPTRYFLEVNAGEAEGLETGDAVIAEGDQIPTTGWLGALLPILGLVGAATLISAAFGPVKGGSER